MHGDPPVADEDRPSQRPASPARTEASALARLAVPVVLAQLGLVAMGLVDTLVVGRVSQEALASVALGNIYWFAINGFCMGVLMALDPLVAQAHGAGDAAGVRRALQRGLVIASALSPPTCVLLLFAGPVLVLLRQPAEVVPDAATYAAITALGTPAFLGFIVVRQTLQAMHLLRAVVASVLIANVVNAVLAIALVHGKWGAPAIGVAGAAWATVGSRWVMFGLLFVLAGRQLRPYLRPFERAAVELAALIRIVRLGVPIGGQFLLEMGMFSAVALLMGVLGTREVASHQIAIVLASFTFMLPLGIAQAAAVRVGNAVGRGAPEEARLSARVAIVGGIVVMLASAATFLSMPRILAKAFTPEPEVIALAATLIAIAGVFQVFDGAQVVAIGVLRGIGDTTTPFVVNVLGFLLFGLPIAVTLGFWLNHGAAGLWWGLVAGLVAVATILLVRVRVRLRGELVRLDH